MKLTKWFPALIKPVHVGVYETYIMNYWRGGYRYWDGECWSDGFDEPKHAEEFKHSKTIWKVTKWRGIKK